MCGNLLFVEFIHCYHLDGISLLFSLLSSSANKDLPKAYFDAYAI